jgi:plasmid stabilization system protein ParE
MPQVIWTRKAVADLSRLRRFLSSKNATAASRAISTIRQSLKLLEAHPETGRPIDGDPSEFREWPIGFGSAAYVTLYVYDGISVTILGIRHSREGGY